MEVLNYPYNDLARFIRNTLLQKDEEVDGLLPLWLFVLHLFIIVSVLLLLLINYFYWKFQEAEDELSRYLQDRNARNVPPNKPIRRTVGSHCHT